MIKAEPALKNLKKTDAGLEPYFDDIRMRIERYNDKHAQLTENGTLTDSATGHLYFGFHRTEYGWVFREWLPGADAVWLFGDFNDWNPYSRPLTHIGNGVWEIRLNGEYTLRHGQCVKLMVGRQGKAFERIPAYILRTVMDERTHRLCGQIWLPDMPYIWQDSKWYAKKRRPTPLIYEAHVGMAQEHGGIGTYKEFAETTLPWIKSMGYNTIQLMAVQEHPYYASFGYQVTNIFAPSYRYGTPEELKALIDKAHSMGIAVVLDVVHSHACPNVGEGLNMQDGTEDQYFLYGPRGWHSAWGTKCFDYGKNRVLEYLLSNLRYWLEEFHFDGFRFDGVTSMLYEDHGLGASFTNYRQYYSMNTNVDAGVYLMLANALVHELNKTAITVAEDMSGMPGMCLPLNQGGFGFDYRLGMGVPDMWIKLIKEQPMESWDVGHIWWELTCGRPKEKVIGYSESHDQAMVGDKTIMFRLADAEMYTGMQKHYHSPTIDTAVDMHKLIRLLTASLAGNGYLNFMGNEFGHPEWIDFPREGNGWSYHYARRQWSLVHNHDLKYIWLAEFDRAMISLLGGNKKHYGVGAENLWLDNEKKLIVFERAGLIYAFNLHPSVSQTAVFINTRKTGEGGYSVVLSSDDVAYGGQGRISKTYVYYPKQEEYGNGFYMYLPCRTAVVLKKTDNSKGL